MLIFRRLALSFCVAALPACGGDADVLAPEAKVQAVRQAPDDATAPATDLAPAVLKPDAEATWPTPLLPHELPPVRFDDVFGAEQAKARLQELVDAVREPSRHAHLGVRPPRGVLLVGPPGSGKTMLARATAKEAQLPIFVTTGSDLLEYSHTGTPLENVRGLFAAARRVAPAIVFIDELDILAGSSSMAKLLGAEMDGFVGDAQVYVLAATNSLEGLPPSLLRAGRFDRIAPVPPPDLAARTAILERAVAETMQADDVDLAKVAYYAEDTSGADLVNLANIAALRAAEARRAAVCSTDWDEALVDMQLGPVDARYVTDRAQLWRTAVHEAGHALLATLLDGEPRLRRVTIAARHGVLGHTSLCPTEAVDSQFDRQTYLNLVATLLAGKLAEEVVLGSFGRGAGNDMAVATGHARAMVTRWGMSEAFVGADLGAIDQPGYTGTLSEATHARVDLETQRILAGEHARARALLTGHKAGLRRIAEALLEQTTLQAEQVRALAFADAPLGAGGAAAEQK